MAHGLRSKIDGARRRHGDGGVNVGVVLTAKLLRFHSRIPNGRGTVCTEPALSGLVWSGLV